MILLKGGWYDGSFQYLQKTGLVEEKNYPYKAIQGTCAPPASAQSYKMESVEKCHNCQTNDWYSKLQKGPIAVIVDASTFQSYRGGVVKLLNCRQPNHAVIAIGWDKDQNGEFITLRNSWGTYWGENGYMRVYINEADNTCFLTSYAYLAVFSGNPPPPPPPPPTNCFSPTASFKLSDLWELPAAFNGNIDFKGKGTDFQVATFDIQNGIGYNVKIGVLGNTSTQIVKDKNIVICQWDISIDPLIYNVYNIAYSNKTGTIIFTVNGLSFTCQNNSNSLLAKFVAFAGNANSSVTICDAKVSTNNK